MSTTYQHIATVASGDGTHVGSATASFKDLVTDVQENSANQTADVLVEDQLQAPLDVMTVRKEREVHKPNSRTELDTL